MCETDGGAPGAPGIQPGPGHPAEEHQTVRMQTEFSLHRHCAHTPEAWKVYNAQGVL